MILRRGGQKGGVDAPVAPGLYRAVPAGTRLARITSRSVVVARSLVLWSAATGATALATR